MRLFILFIILSFPAYAEDAACPSIAGCIPTDSECWCNGNHCEWRALYCQCQEGSNGCECHDEDGVKICRKSPPITN